MSAFPTKAAPKTATLHFRGVNFTLRVSDDPEHDGYILVQLEGDPPPPGLDRTLYTVHMKPMPRDYYECTICNGEGEFFGNELPGYDAGWHLPDRLYPCPSCGGTGNRRDQRYM